jgi:glucose-1-phosphate cytidylyltransferase
MVRASPPADLSHVPLIILCGGQGTRLREETEFIPKPMVDIGGRPILWHIMKHYYQFGVRDIYLCLGYKGGIIKNYFLDYRYRDVNFSIDFSQHGPVRGSGIEFLDGLQVEDWRVSLVETGAESQTATRIKRVLNYLKAPRFFVTYGDGLSDVDIAGLLACHQQAGRLATLTAVRPSSRFGELGLVDGRVESFREKPQVSEGWINGGFQVFERAAFDAVDPAVDDVVLETDVLRHLADQQQLSVFEHHGFWQAMDTYREAQLLRDMWARGNPPWRTW